MFTLNSELALTDEELLTHAQSLSYNSGSIREKLLHWEFGPLMTMKFDEDASNYLFSDEAVPFHWDGAFKTEPSLLLFYCTESEGAGGETIFVNTEKLWNSLSPEEQETCRGITLTYKTEKLAHYGGTISLPLVQKHPVTGKTILRMAERVESNKNPVTLTISGTEEAEAFYQKMVKRMYEQSFQHQWKKGDLLCVDNATYLHGRLPLGRNLRRSFKRIQIL